MAPIFSIGQTLFIHGSGRTELRHTIRRHPVCVHCSAHVQPEVWRRRVAREALIGRREIGLGVRIKAVVRFRLRFQ